MTWDEQVERQFLQLPQNIDPIGEECLRCPGKGVRDEIARYQNVPIRKVDNYVAFRVSFSQAGDAYGFPSAVQNQLLLENQSGWGGMDRSNVKDSCLAPIPHIRSGSVTRRDEDAACEHRRCPSPG